MNGEEFCFAYRRRCSFIQWLTRYVTTLSYYALSSGFSSNSTCVKKGVLGTANVSSQQGLCYTQNTTQQTALIYDDHNICRFSRLIQLKNPLQWQCTPKSCVSQKLVKPTATSLNFRLRMSLQSNVHTHVKSQKCLVKNITSHKL